MSRAFKSMQRAAFAEIAFPVEEVSVSGSIRDHQHVYPHAPGAAIEKMGRNLYLIRMQANFQDTFTGEMGTRPYPDLWPKSLATLRNLFEEQVTELLMVPSVGYIRAYCRNWSQSMTAKIQSGEKATFEFVEDQGSIHLSDGSVILRSNLDATWSGVSNEFETLRDFYAPSDFPGDIFSGLTAAMNDVLAIGDTAQAEGYILISKLMQVQSLCQELDGHRFAQNPMNALALEAFYNLRDAVNATANSVAGNKALMTYTVPVTMPMSSISTKLYADTSHTVELMQLNVVADVFRVPAGTVISYVPPEKTVTYGTRSEFGATR